MSREFRENSRHDDAFWKTKMELERRREDQAQKYQEDSNSRLCKIVAKNFETVIIGAISDFEEDFGYIFGYGKADKDLTDNERMAKQVWEDTRKSILDRGNAKKRATVKEVQNHEVKWKRNVYKFNFRREE